MDDEQVEAKGLDFVSDHCAFVRSANQTVQKSFERLGPFGEDMAAFEITTLFI
jgi:hypothetical protein